MMVSTTLTKMTATRPNHFTILIKMIASIWLLDPN